LELSPILNRLTALEMAMCQLDATDLRELFHYCTSPLTSCLRLQRNPLGWQGVRALQEAPFLQALTELDLSSCQLNSRAMATFGQLRFGQLRTLRLNHNLIDHRGARELAQSDVLSGVYELSLRGTRDQSRRGQFKLGDAGFNALIGNGLRSLQVLDAARNELRTDSVTSLLAASNLDQLVSVDLSDNLLDDVAARHLIEHGPWRELMHLKLTNNPISDSARRVLQREFHSRVVF